MPDVFLEEIDDRCAVLHYQTPGRLTAMRQTLYLTGSLAPDENTRMIKRDVHILKQTL
jgi:hypothetical protein